MKMRVLHFDIERGWRGGERQVELLVAGLANHGIDQMVACRKGQPLAQKVRSIGIETWEVNNRLQLFGQLSAHLTPGTIYHAHTGNTIPAAVYGAQKSQGYAVITRRLDLPVKPYFFKKANATVAISTSVRRQLIGQGIEENKIHLIPSAVPAAAAIEKNVASELRLRCQIPDGRPVVLSIGALVDQKRPTYGYKSGWPAPKCALDLGRRRPIRTTNEAVDRKNVASR